MVDKKKKAAIPCLGPLLAGRLRGFHRQILRVLTIIGGTNDKKVEWGILIARFYCPKAARCLACCIRTGRMSNRGGSRSLAKAWQFACAAELSISQAYGSSRIAQYS